MSYLNWRLINRKDPLLKKRIFNIGLSDNKLTNFFEHFVALIENEDLKVSEVKVSSLDESKDSSWCAHDNVRLLDTLEESNVLVKGHTTIDNLCAQLGELLLESIELLLDLVGKLSIVAENKS